MGRDTDLTERLRRDIARAIIHGTGMREDMALPVADSVLAWLQADHAGQRMYIPAAPRQYNVLQIAADHRGGMPIAELCRTHSISKRTLQRLLGTLPLHSKSSAR